MRSDTEEIIFKMLEAKGGLNKCLDKPKTKQERYSEELKEMDVMFTKSLISKALKKFK